MGDRAIVPEPGMKVKCERNEDFLESTKTERARTCRMKMLKRVKAMGLCEVVSLGLLPRPGLRPT